MGPGIYRLNESVDNPHGDRRCTQYWRRPVWEKGDRFIVRTDDEPSLSRLLTIRPLAFAEKDLTWTPKNLPLLDALCQHLELEPESLESILAVTGRSSDYVLGRLLKAEIITLDDVKAHLSAEAPML